FIESLDIESFFIESLDILSFDMVSFFMSSANALVASGPIRRPPATRADNSMPFLIELSSRSLRLRSLRYHRSRTRPHQFPVAASWRSPHGFVRMTAHT